MKKWQTVNFSKQKLTKTQIAKLDIEQLQILRGIVFGKRGRIFKEKTIQDYLTKQSWYKPKENFSNDVLTKTERDNLDVIRLAEAAVHDSSSAGRFALLADARNSRRKTLHGNFGAVAHNDRRSRSDSRQAF